MKELRLAVIHSVVSCRVVCLGWTSRHVADATSSLAPLQRRGMLAQRWLRNVVVAAVVVYTGWKLKQHWRELPAMAREATDSVTQFVNEHVSQPIKCVCRGCVCAMASVVCVYV